MAASDYERVACEALGMKHISAIKQGELYHNVGEFEIASSPDSIRAIADYHRSFVSQAIEEEATTLPLHLQNRAKKEWGNDEGFLSFGQYCEAVANVRSLSKARDSYETETPSAHILKFLKHFDPETFTKDEFGYAVYLTAIIPQFGKFLKHKTPALIDDKTRKYHTYVVGKTGSGKSTLLKTFMHGYVSNPNYNGSIIVLDPLGEMVREVSRWREFADNDKLVLIDPSLSPEMVPQMNPLDLPEGVPADTYAQELASIFEDMITDTGQTFSPNMRSLMRYTLRVLIETENTTLMDLMDFLTPGSDGRWIEKGRQSLSQSVRYHFTNRFNNKNYQITKDAICNKIDAILSHDAAEKMFLGKSSFNLEKLLDNRKAVLVNLSKGRIGEGASEALGRFIIGKLHGIAIRRDYEPRLERVPIHAFVDECQNFVGGKIGTILAEDRKYGLHMTLANQYRRQIRRQEVREGILNNTKIKIAGLSSIDNITAKELAIPPEALGELQQGEFYCRPNPTTGAIVIHVRGDLADDRNDMPPAQWEQVKQQQLARYYTPIDDGTNSTPEPSKRPPLR